MGDAVRGDLDTGTTPFVIVERVQLRRLRAVATRLYSENRLGGDEMRDLAHTITSVLDQSLDLPEAEAPRGCPICGRAETHSHGAKS